MKRRSLLIGLGALALNPLTTGCSNRREADLHLQVLSGSLPAQLIQTFQHRQQPQLQRHPVLGFTPQPQLEDLFTLLQTWKQRSTAGNSSQRSWNPLARSTNAADVADLVTLGDYWLLPAIQQGLIQPFDATDLQGWEMLSPQWRSLMTAYATDQPTATPPKQLWAAPYRWGTMVIAYRNEEFQSLKPPTDWADLWRPELQGRISLLDGPRETIGLTLKKLGQSFNPSNLNAVAALPSELAALHRQARFYSSDAYLQPLLLGDTWVAVGWSTDVLPVIKRDRRITAIVPTSGTILTADVWVRPAREAASPAVVEELLKQWIDFCWQPEAALQMAILGQSASPVLTTLDRTQLPSTVRENAILLPPQAVLERSELLKPLNTTTAEQYRQVWQALR
jgi:putative spermidine/putrescine transport system substrate-binding protein